MQGKVPELLDLSKEPQTVLDAYGVQDGPAGSFARQCLMARKLSEAGVRFVEVCDPGWDHHNNLHQGLTTRCKSVDQPIAALLDDLSNEECWKTPGVVRQRVWQVASGTKDQTDGITT